MKQLLFFLLLPTIYIACNKPDDNGPGTGPLSAAFSLLNTGPIVAGCGEVRLNNTSQNADSYLWNFGDGNTSAEKNPVHVYANPGTYNIVLIAQKDSESKEASRIITITGTPKFSNIKIQTNGKPRTVRTPDGGFVTAGTGLSITGNRDARVYKTSATGVLEWDRILGGSTTYTTDVALAPDGNLLICGFTSNNSSDGQTDGYIWKMDQSGNVIWGRQVSEPSTQTLNAIIAFSDGSCWAVGYNIYLSSVPLAFLVGFDAAGNQLFATNTGGTGANNTGVDLVETADGQVLVCGYGDADINSTGANKDDIWINKLSKSNRTLLWSRNYGSTNQADHPASIIRTQDNGFAVAGKAVNFSSGGGVSYPLLLKIDGNGNQINLINSTSGLSGSWNSLTEASDGSLTITGRIQDDLRLVNMNPAGTTTNWAKTITAPGAYLEEGWNVLTLPEGGFVVSGITADASLAFEQFKSWVFKTDCSGN